VDFVTSVAADFSLSRVQYKSAATWCLCVCAVIVSKEVVGMSCGFRDGCGCGYQFVSSNINLVWKRLLRDVVQTADQTDPDETVATIRGLPKVH